MVNLCRSPRCSSVFCWIHCNFNKAANALAKWDLSVTPIPYSLLAICQMWFLLSGGLLIVFGATVSLLFLIEQKVKKHNYELTKLTEPSLEDNTQWAYDCLITKCKANSPFIHPCIAIDTSVFALVAEGNSLSACLSWPLYILPTRMLRQEKTIMHPWIIQTSRSTSHSQEESYLNFIVYTSKECIT